MYSAFVLRFVVVLRRGRAARYLKLGKLLYCVELYACADRPARTATARRNILARASDVFAPLSRSHISGSRRVSLLTAGRVHATHSALVPGRHTAPPRSRRRDSQNPRRPPDEPCPPAALSSFKRCSPHANAHIFRGLCDGNLVKAAITSFLRANSEIGERIDRSAAAAALAAARNVTHSNATGRSGTPNATFHFEFNGFGWLCAFDVMCKG